MAHIMDGPMQCENTICPHFFDEDADCQQDLMSCTEYEVHIVSSYNDYRQLLPYEQAKEAGD